MKISVIIPNFNYGQYLEQAIQSVIAQQYPETELIVIDGGSTDNSIQIIQKYTSVITHWESAVDNGQTDAIIKGLKKASGTIVTWLNSDDFYMPAAFNAVRAFYQKHPNTDFLAGNCNIVDASGRIIDTPETILQFSEEGFYENLKSYLPQPGSFFTKKCYEKVGGLDVSLRYTMDLDFWYRLSEIKADFKQTSTVLANFRQHPSSKTSHGTTVFLTDIIKKHGNPHLNNQEIGTNLQKHIQKESWAFLIKELLKISIDDALYVTSMIDDTIGFQQVYAILFRSKSSLKLLSNYLLKLLLKQSLFKDITPRSEKLFKILLYASFHTNSLYYKKATLYSILFKKTYFIKYVQTKHFLKHD